MPQTERLGVEIGFETKNQAAVKQAEQNITNVGKAAKTATAAMQTAEKSSNKLRGSFSALNNIVRDAPYGINGVANNITQLGDALFGASLAAQVVGLGLSLLVTGAVALTQKYGSLGGAIDALLNPLNEQQRIQRTVNDVMAQGEKDAQKEIVALDTLYKATQNSSIALSERNKLVDELQSRYPQYLGNLSNEQILAGKAAAQYEKLRGSILAAAQARAIQDKVADISSKLLDIDIKRTDQTQKLAKAQAEQRKADQQAAQVRTSGIGQGAITQLDQFQAAGLAAAAAVGNLQAEISDLNNEERELQTTIDQLLSKQNALIQQFGAVGTGLLDVSDSVKKVKKDLDDIGFRTLQGVLRNAPVLKPKIPVEMQLVGVEAARQNLAKQLKPLNTELTEQVTQLTIDTEAILQQGAGRIVSGIATAVGGIIGGALTLREGLNSIVVVMADFITQLGESLIAAGTATIAANALSTNPATAIAAGFIAVAAGAAVRAALDKAPSFATGGTALGPQFALIGDNPARKEHILSDAQLDRIAGGGVREIRVVGEIRGQVIALANERALGTIGRVS